MPLLIHKVSAPNGWMSNMSRHAVQHGAHQYATAEGLFQALRFSDPEIQAQIRAIHNPLQAKHFARSLDGQMTVERLSPQDLENMRLVLRLKLQQHPELAVKLLVTGEEQIIEDCTRRPHGSGPFWGAVLQADGTWQGENWLGRLWMELRATL